MKSKLDPSTGGKIQGGAFYIGSYQNVYCVVCKEQAVKRYSCPNGCAAEEHGVAALQTANTRSPKLLCKYSSECEFKIFDFDKVYCGWKHEHCKYAVVAQLRASA